MMDFSSLPGYPAIQHIIPLLPKADLEKGPWIAGGFLVRMYANLPMYYSEMTDRGEVIREADIDYWCDGERQFQEVSAICAETMRLVVETDISRLFKFRVDNFWYAVQVIKRDFYPSPLELVDNFDFSICRAYTDLNTAHYTEEAISDLSNGIFRMVNGNHHNNILKRMMKYLALGYTPEPCVLSVIASLDAKSYQDMIDRLSRASAYRGF